MKLFIDEENAIFKFSNVPTHDGTLDHPSQGSESGTGSSRSRTPGPGNLERAPGLRIKSGTRTGTEI